MRQAVEPISLNGAHGEGGGALFRTALAMSSLTLQGVRIHSIRGAGRKPGVTAEDLTYLHALAKACRAAVEGDTLDSRIVSFVPGVLPQALKGNFDISSHEQGKVPGNCQIVLGSLLPVLARTGAMSSLSIDGETHNNNTLGYDSFERSTLAAYRRMGLYAFPSLVSTGFGFGTKGRVALEVEPSAIECVQWPSRGDLKTIWAVICATDMAPEALERAKVMLEQHFREKSLEGEVEVVCVFGPEPGCSITIGAEFERGFGQANYTLPRGGTLASVVERAWQPFWAWFSGDATVDTYLADQLLLPAVLATGRSHFTTPQITRRLITMSWVVKQFLPIKITVMGREGEPGSITVER